MRLIDALGLAQTVLALEWGCAPGDFDRQETLVLERADERAGWPREARRYPAHHPALALVSFGQGAAIAASAELLPDVRAIFAGCARDQAFETARLAAADTLLRPYGYRLGGPLPRLVCGVDTLRDCSVASGVTVEVEPLPPVDRLVALGGAETWPNAISQRALAAAKQEAAIAVARAGDRTVGLASAGMDALHLWQIGVDVAPTYRGAGIGAALVSTLARYVLGQGAVPWYGLAPANIPSLRTALAAGFRPAWLEAFTYGPGNRRTDEGSRQGPAS